jgi:hypothetical protein
LTFRYGAINRCCNQSGSAGPGKGSRHAIEACGVEQLGFRRQAFSNVNSKFEQRLIGEHRRSLDRLFCEFPAFDETTGEPNGER